MAHLRGGLFGLPRKNNEENLAGGSALTRSSSTSTSTPAKKPTEMTRPGHAFSPLSGNDDTAPASAPKKEAKEISIPVKVASAVPVSQIPYMTKEVLLIAIKQNSQTRFPNEDVYAETQRPFFFHAALKSATVAELINAGMRDAKDAENRPYKSTDEKFKSLMLGLCSEVTHRTYGAQFSALKEAWDAARVEPKTPRARASTGGQFKPSSAPITAKADVDPIDDSLRNFFALR